ncbi:unnamed protein product, partial [Acidithrix sp. C25]
VKGGPLVGFELHVVEGGAADFHRDHIIPPLTRSVFVSRLQRPAIILGSTQKLSDDMVSKAKEIDFELVRRSSGGTGVIALPHECVWIDISFPVDDPLIEANVSRSFDLVARGWFDALSFLGVSGLEVKGRPIVMDPLASQVCFTSKAPGEILVGGRKLVGMAQRRSRHACFIHTMCYIKFPYDLTSQLLLGEIDSVDHLRQMVTDLIDVAPWVAQSDDLTIGNLIGEAIF